MNLDKRRKCLLTLLAVLMIVATSTRAQKNLLRGSIDYCNAPAERTLGANPAGANRSVAQSITIFNTDFVSAGVGGMRDVGNGQIVIGGINGPVTRAYLYWHGVTNNTNNVGFSITVNSATIIGTSIGISDNNCWGYNNSQAYRADVTPLVLGIGNGTYNLSGFGDLNPNGASLIVFFNDGTTSNNRDVVIFDGNDSNIPFAGIPSNPDAPADPAGWNVLLSGINYTSGTANIQMHVADGQAFSDDGVSINSNVLIPAGANWEGNTVPGANNGPANNGRLWDIRTFNVTTFLSPGPNTLNLTSGTGSDCLGLIVAMIDLPAGAAPITTFYSKATGNLNLLSTWGTNLDGTGTAPTDFGAAKTFNLANRAGVYTLTGDWSVDGTIVNPAGSVLQLNGFTLAEASLSGAGTIAGSATSNLVVMGNLGGDAGTLNFTPSAAILNNFTLNRTGAFASATIGATQLSVSGVLTITNGTLNTNNVLTLKSSAANTARVAPITGAISGNVTVERYIPARRAWRILAAPVGGSQTIKQSIQEGAANTAANPAPNFGTFITGGSVADGFDQNPGATSSMKFYNNAVNNWVGIPNTNTTTVGGIAYMTFVYGNRNTNTISVGLTPGNTTLRATGSLKVGDQAYPVSATGFTSIPNPFASPINFATITRSGVANTFYLWDPKIGGANGVGAYVTVSFNGSTYDVSANAISPESQYIQSGQGFLVYPSTSGTAGSITIKESDKSATAATDVFRTTGGGNTIPTNAPVFADASKGQGLRLNLQAVTADGSIADLDGAFDSYQAGYLNKLDALDAVKPTNVKENLGIVTDGQTLSIERRALPTMGDVIQLKLWNTEIKNYILEVNPINLSGTGLNAFLKDSYLGTVTPIDLGSISHTSFSVTANAASAKTDRFSIAFAKADKKQDLITATDIVAYPNPVVGRNITLQFRKQPAGLYQVSIATNTGVVMVKKTIQYNGVSGTQTLTIDKKLPAGVYQMQVVGETTRANQTLLCQ